MFIENYEKNYNAADDAERILGRIKPVVEFLREHREPMTCKEIGVAIWGDKYDSYWSEKKQRYTGCEITPQKLGNILSHLVELGMLAAETVKDEPIEIDIWGWEYEDGGWHEVVTGKRIVYPKHKIYQFVKEV